MYLSSLLTDNPSSPLPQACSNIYFTLDALHQIHFLYQYSLHFFLDVFTDVLSNNPNIKDQTDYSRRLSIITNDLFQVCDKSTSVTQTNWLKLCFTTNFQLEIAAYDPAVPAPRAVLLDNQSIQLERTLLFPLLKLQMYQIPFVEILLALPVCMCVCVYLLGISKKCSKLKLKFMKSYFMS